MKVDWDKITITKIDVEDRMTINKRGMLEEVTLYNIWERPKATLENIEVNITITPSGTIFDDKDGC